MEKRPIKFRRKQTVAMETVADFCFSSLTHISMGGQPIVLKFWQSVLLMQRYNLCIEHNFVRLIYFLKQARKPWNDQKYCSERGLNRGGLEHVMNLSLK